MSGWGVELPDIFHTNLSGNNLTPSSRPLSRISRVSAKPHITGSISNPNFDETDDDCRLTGIFGGLIVPDRGSLSLEGHDRVVRGIVRGTEDKHMCRLIAMRDVI